MEEDLIDNLLEEHITFEKEQVHVLTALYGAVCQSIDKKHIEISKSIELMKAATLIIDDFLDKAPKRNGIPSIYFEKGAEEAVLIGEILKSLSLIEFIKHVEKLEDVSSGIKFKAIKLFEWTYKEVCLGQLKDMELERKEIGKHKITEEDYLDMIKKTSAIFIQFPVVLGALFSNFNEQEITCLKDFGIKIGLAYQLRDDVLDIIGDQDYLGKLYAGDIRERKKRILLIYSLKNGLNEDKERLQTIYNKKEEVSDEEVKEVIEIFKRTGAIDYCISLIDNYCKKAIDNLSYIKNSKIVTQLKDIAFLLTRFDDVPPYSSGS